jgi:hypothetical protein
MVKLKGIFALPAQISAWDDVDVITTLKRFKIVRFFKYYLLYFIYLLITNYSRQTGRAVQSWQ